MISTGRSVDEISEFMLFTVTDDGHFEFYALENFARLFKKGVGAYFFTNTLCYLKQPSNITCRRLFTESLILYWSEVWGDEQCDILEKLQLRFCKYILAVNKFTCSNMVYG